MAVAGTCRGFRATRVKHAEVGGERGIDGVLHRHFDHAGNPGVLALVQRRHDRAEEMDAGHEIAKGRAGFHRRLVGVAGRGDHAGHRLHDEVHGGIVTVRTALAVTRAGTVDEPRVDLLQVGGADAEAVHHARREVLDQYIGTRHQLLEQRAALLGLEVEGDGLLVRIQHRERQGGPTRVAAAAQVLALERLDLDDVRTGHCHEKGGVRAVVEVGEVDDGDTRKRVPGLDRGHGPF